MLVCAMLMAKWTRVGAAGLLAERMRVEGVGLPAVGSVIISSNRGEGTRLFVSSCGVPGSMFVERLRYSGAGGG
jgi:hypothetical protein